MRTIKKPDLNAPRFREKRTSLLTLETLDKFKASNPKYKDLSYADFKNIIMVFNKKLVEGIIDNRNGVELPERLGVVFLGTCPPAKKKNIDFQKSHQYGVEATHRNWDSDNKLLKIFYTNNTKYTFQNRQAWVFKPVRQFKRNASKAYRENWEKYIEVSPKEKISGMFQRYRRKEYVKNLTPVIPEGYDEFNLN